MTCWRRLAEWTEAGVRPRLRETLLAKLRSANALDFSRAAVDGSHIRALKGEPRPDEAPSTGAEAVSTSGRPRRRPDAVPADRGYDHDKDHRLVRDPGVKPLITRRGIAHGSGLGTQRRVVERAFAHLHWYRRLRIRWEIRDDIREAFLTLGCALICRRRLAAGQRRHS